MHYESQITVCMIILQKNEQQRKYIQFLRPKFHVNSERTVIGLTYAYLGKARALQILTQPSYFSQSLLSFLSLFIPTSKDNTQLCKMEEGKTNKRLI